MFENGEEMRIGFGVVEFLPQHFEHGGGALRVNVVEASVALGQLLLVLRPNLS